jgi:cytochrome oxidase assembly protein ShyY1
VGLFVLLVVVVAACAWLGRWQWERSRVEVVSTPPAGVVPLDDVHAPGRPVAPEDAGRRVSLTGEFDNDREVVVIERQSDGELGSWVVTAFETASGAVVPVVRGWLPDGESVPEAPAGEIEMVGTLEPTEPDALRDPTRGPLDSGQVEVVSSAELLSLWQPPLYQGFFIMQRPAPASPLVGIPSPARAVKVVTNWQNAAYGVQWWLFGLFAIFWFVRMVRVEAEDRRGQPGVPEVDPVGTMEGEPEEHT